jgi:hypothetical protein
MEPPGQAEGGIAQIHGGADWQGKYKNAGTMEYLVVDQNCPYFIKVNPRIQVRGERERAKLCGFLAFAFVMLFSLVYLRRGQSLKFLFPDQMRILAWTRGTFRRWEAGGFVYPRGG